MDCHRGYSVNGLVKGIRRLHVMTIFYPKGLIRVNVYDK